MYKVKDSKGETKFESDNLKEAENFMSKNSQLGYLYIPSPEM